MAKLGFTMIYRGMDPIAAGLAYQQMLELEKRLHIDIPDAEDRRRQWEQIALVVTEYILDDGEHNFPKPPSTLGRDEWRTMGGPDYTEAFRWKQLALLMLLADARE